MADTRGPREVFELVRQRWLRNEPGLETDLLDPDIVVESPFAPPGRPTRHEGRERFLAYATPLRAALPVRFEDVRDITIHDTADPEVIVVEYVIAGTITTTGRQGSAPFVAVLRVRDGRITHWREYQNPLAMAEINAAEVNASA